MTPARLRVAGPARSGRRQVGGVLALAVAYYLAGRASLALQYDGPVAALWLPSGVGAAVLYRAGLRWWPGVVIADLALIDPSQPPATALGITAGNLADVLTIAIVLRSMFGPQAALDRVEQVGGMLIAILVGAIISATTALLCASAGGVIADSAQSEFWRSWLLSDACGSLVVIPLVLAWTQPPSRDWPRRAWWEAPLILLALVALSAASLSAPVPLTYTVFPALIWAALRFGPRGATLAVAVAAVTTVALTAAEVGAYVEHSITDVALSTQLYIAVAAVTTLYLAALDSERRRARHEVDESRARIAAAGARERRRLELELHDTAQSRLVALLIRLSVLREQVPSAWTEGAAAVDALSQEAEALGDELRRIAQRIAPPLLAGGGLISALAVECARSGIDVEIEADDIGCSTPEVELAVYSCALDAVRRAAPLEGAGATVRLRREADRLDFSVHVPDGAGFDEHPGPSALLDLRDRIESVGGCLELVSRPGGGLTAVAGTVPWPPPDAARRLAGAGVMRSG